MVSIVPMASTLRPSLSISCSSLRFARLGLSSHLSKRLSFLHLSPSSQQLDLSQQKQRKKMVGGLPREKRREAGQQPTPAVTTHEGETESALIGVKSSCSRRVIFVLWSLHLGSLLASPQLQPSGLKASKSWRGQSGKFPVAAAGNTAQASTSAVDENVLEWVKKDSRRMLHVVYRVGDLDRTIKFYTECLGMKLLRKRDIPEDRYTNAFLGYGPEDSHFVIELTYNYGVDKYDIGTGFGHFGVAVEDVAKTVDLVKAKGGKVTREAGPVKGGKTVIAFVEDPDGYKFELIERGPTPEPLCQVMLRVGDLNRAIDFYKKAYGMELLRTRDNPEYKYTIAMMGYGPEESSAVVELTYNYGVTEYDKGNGYAQIAIGTDDVYKTAEAVKLCGGKIMREPGPLPGISTKITACLDPDGWKTVFVDNIDFRKELE